MSLLEIPLLEAWRRRATRVVWDVVSDPRTYPRWWRSFARGRPPQRIDGVGASAART